MTSVTLAIIQAAYLMPRYFKFAKLLDFRPQVNSIWIPESWGREAFVMIGAIGRDN